MNASHATNRVPGERGNAQLECRRVLRCYRGCLHRLITTIGSAVWMLITAGQSTKWTGS